LRKVAEGKNKMSVLNAIRGKLILRMFAVIRDNRMYEKEYVTKYEQADPVCNNNKRTNGNKGNKKVVHSKKLVEKTNK